MGSTNRITSTGRSPSRKIPIATPPDVYCLPIRSSSELLSRRRTGMRTGSKNPIFVWCLLLALAMAALFFTPRASAQVLYGSVVGNVTDPSGGNIPGANVTITNKQTNLSRETATDADGVFSLLAIPTGTYAIRVTKSGFKAFENTEVPVTLNTVTRVEASLQVGEMTQTVTVTAETPPLQTDTSEVRADVGVVELENLPGPVGRNYQQLYRTLSR